MSGSVGQAPASIWVAFAHMNLEGGRFSDGTYGVFFAVNELGTAMAETIRQREHFMRTTKQEHMELDMPVYVTDLAGQFHDLRE